MMAQRKDDLPEVTQDQMEHVPAIEVREYEDPHPELQKRWNKDMTLVLIILVAIFLAVIAYILLS
jgi:hypothetical protein